MVYKKKSKKPASNITEKVTPAAPPTLGVALVLEPGQTVRIAVSRANGTTCGRMLGTLLVGVDGLEYRWPSAKKSTGRRLSWDVLTKLMQSGLI